MSVDSTLWDNLAKLCFVSILGLNEDSDKMMTFFQYTYYMTCEMDKPRKWSARVSKMRAAFLLGLGETFMLAALYLFIARMVVGHPIYKPPLPFSIPPAIASFTLAFILCYMNVLIIGDEHRTHRYKELFDSWDKGRRLRWKILQISTVVLSLAVYYVVAETCKWGLVFQNWK